MEKQMMSVDWGRIVDRRLAALETHHAVEEVHQNNVEKRLSAIEDTLKWLVRLVLSALIMAALSVLLHGGINV